MTNMRAKVKVTNVNTYEGCVNLTFNAVCPKTFKEDGTDENNTFAKWTPTAEFKMTVTNPTLFDKFKINTEYYVDFTPANKVD